MPDTPTLTRSSAARDSLPTTPIYGAHGKTLNPLTGPSRPGHYRGFSDSSMSQDPSNLPSDYFGAALSRPDLPRRGHSSDLRSGMASPMMPEVPSDLQQKPTTEIRAGSVQKPFRITTELLVTKCPYFAALQRPEVITTSNYPPPSRLSGPFFFPDLDEFAFALFTRWIYDGQLHGPRDFHTTNHYVALYVLASKFRIEVLKNTVMDLLRGYYHRENMTAPAFRLDYIYANTDGPNPMREFLVTTAAYRAMAEKPEGISESIKGVLRGGGEAAVDFVLALVTLHNNERVDVRKGDECRWHEHEVTVKCKAWGGFQPWEHA